MRRGMLTEDELSCLRSLDAVARAEPLRITHPKPFKREFMRRYHAGERPKAIFASPSPEREPYRLQKDRARMRPLAEGEIKERVAPG